MKVAARALIGNAELMDGTPILLPLLKGYSKLVPHLHQSTSLLLLLSSKNAELINGE
jgi:hypothetical protein